jgi:hypothetical protein
MQPGSIPSFAVNRRRRIDATTRSAKTRIDSSPSNTCAAIDAAPETPQAIEAESAPITLYSLRTRKEFVLREVAEAMEDGRDVMEVLNRLLLADGLVAIAVNLHLD